MKNLSSLLILLFISFSAYAGSDGNIEKPFTIGIATYRSVIAYDNAFAGDDELTGIAFSLGYAGLDQFAVRGTYFSLEHDDFSDIESTGYDLLVHLGTGLATQGFKAYIGGGIFSDKWEIGSFSKTFSGLQLNGGIGYNWESVALELILGIRDASDYEEFINANSSLNISAAAVTGSLLVSYRF